MGWLLDSLRTFRGDVVSNGIAIQGLLTAGGDINITNNTRPISASDNAKILLEQSSFLKVPRAVNSLFTGRQRSLSDICAVLGQLNNSQQQRYVITGLGGIGKSELCLKLVEHMHDVFWGKFWIDVSNVATAAKEFHALANRFEPCSEVLTEALGVISRIPKSWLLVLDNADDPNVDYGNYFPPGSNGTIVITSRNSECSIHQTVGHTELEAMSTEDSVMLLLRAAKHTAHISSSTYEAAQVVVELLGGHTLALIQAGSYIGQRFCTLAQYPRHYENARQRLLEFQPRQATSRYGNVYATFEASAQQLESPSSKTGNLALRLLGIISYLHYTSLPVNMFEAAWAGARFAVEKSPSNPGTNLEVYTTDVIVQLLDIVPVTSNVWDIFHLNEALGLLDSLALLKRDFSGAQTALISMHPLTHAWTKDRQSVDAQRTSWKRAGALIALSAHDIVWNPWNSIWRLHEDLLRAHVQSYIASQNGPSPEKLHTSFLMQVQYRCAAILQRMRCDQELKSLLDRVEQRDEDIPSGAVLPFAKYKARNLSNLGHCSQSIELWEHIISIEREALDESDYVLLVSRHELGSAYLDAGRVFEAIDVFQDVIPKKQTKLPAEHGDLIASMHELGRAYLDAARYCEAIPLLDNVVNITARHFQPNHPDLLVSQHELGRSLPTQFASRQGDRSIRACHQYRDERKSHA